MKRTNPAVSFPPSLVLTAGSKAHALTHEHTHTPGSKQLPGCRCSDAASLMIGGEKVAGLLFPAAEPRSGMAMACWCCGDWCWTRATPAE
ncbi:hypothetical protein K432DRAFT_8981 [Lepidopterella palustris CBS 459.81]|uniref:Uncharacterized protein n=1 Tax=Lepidopterella palustris CBS 459.81 TaxID=1314670 RepID=A0A8E2DX82_9PEZI|nr:hypothetical protein K432DRAFT_8981 [Lepidopterella palustris CBS 459.81]